MNPLSRVFLVIYLAMSCSVSANGSKTPDSRSNGGGVRVALLIIAKGVPSPTAPLRWALYASAEALPGVFSRGRPFRAGVSDSSGDPTIIEVGLVPVGDYFAIIAQDTNRDGDIGGFSEPRGYSGYDGCLSPSWSEGAQTVDEKSHRITVYLHCNRHDTRGNARD